MTMEIGLIPCSDSDETFVLEPKKMESQDEEIR